jgi:hypothetical protein
MVISSMKLPMTFYFDNCVIHVFYIFSATIPFFLFVMCIKHNSQLLEDQDTSKFATFLTRSARKDLQLHR